MCRKVWCSGLNGTALTHSSWGCSSYTPGHEFKAVQGTSTLVSERPWRLRWVVFKMHHSKPVNSTHCKMGCWFGMGSKSTCRACERRWDVWISYREVHIHREVTCSCPSWANDSEPDFTWPPESMSLRDFMVLMLFISESNLVQCKWGSNRVLHRGSLTDLGNSGWFIFTLGSPLDF